LTEEAKMKAKEKGISLEYEMEIWKMSPLNDLNAYNVEPSFNYVVATKPSVKKKKKILVILLLMFFVAALVSFSFFWDIQTSFKFICFITIFTPLHKHLWNRRNK